MKFFWLSTSYSSLGLGALMLGQLMLGCAFLPPQVHFTLPLPSKIKLPLVQSIAILDFAVSLDQASQGRIFSEQLAQYLQDNESYRIIPPGVTRQFIKQYRLAPSRFQELGVLRKAGRQLSTDALLYGDLPILQLRQQEREEILSRTVGEEYRAVVVTNAAGNTQTVWQRFPILKKYRQRTLERQVFIQADARLVRTSDGAILWQRGHTFKQQFIGVETEGEGRKGAWQSDQQLIAQGLKITAEALIKDLLPSFLNRTRILVRAMGPGGEYAELIEQGIRAAMEDHWLEAGNWWLRAAGLSEQRPEARANLGVLRERAKEYQQALEDYRLAAEKLGSPWDQYFREVEMMISSAQK